MAAMMPLAAIGMTLPTILGIVHQLEQRVFIGSSFQDPALDLLSPLIAAVLLVLYISDHFSIPPTAVSRE